MIENKIILIGGMPASGKTTLGKLLAKTLKLPYLDKDTLCDKYTNYVVAKETFPNDRSSELYTKTLRNLEYEIMFHVALEQVSLELCPVLVSPFSSEFIDEDKMKEMERRLKEVNPNYEMVSVLVEADPDEVKEKIVERNRKEDSEKINQWETYIQGKINFQEKAKKNVSLTVKAYSEDALTELVNFLKVQND